MTDPLTLRDAQERYEALHSPDDHARAYLLWLLHKQFERDYRKGADSQKLIKLMNEIKALERGEVST